MRPHHTQSNEAWFAIRDGRIQEGMAVLERLFRDYEPGSAEYSNRGLAYLLLGRFDEAAHDLDEQRRQIVPCCAFTGVGTALWLAGNHTAACEDWADLVAGRRNGIVKGTDEAGGVMAPALLWWASTHAGCEGWRPLAVEEMKVLGHRAACRRSRWPGGLVPYLTGSGDPEELLSAAASESSIVTAENVCQARFYIAARAADEGDLATRDAYLAAAATLTDPHVVLRNEYHLARGELRALGHLRDP